MAIDSNNNNTEYPEIALIPPELYEPMQKKALHTIAGHPGIKEKDLKELSNILGIDEVVEWKKKLKLVYPPT